MYKDIDIFDLLTDESKEKIMKELKEAKAEAKKDGRAEGLVEGRAEGEKLGIAKGKKAGILETAKNLLKLGIPNDKIAEATKLDIEEIKTLSAQMV